LTTEVSALLTGCAIGFGASLVGGVLTYLLYLRGTPAEERTRGPVGMVLLVNSLLVAIGFVVLVASAYSGRLLSAVIAGAGVFAGYMAAFLLLTGIWILMDRSGTS
jgi:hypothetical protein